MDSRQCRKCGEVKSLDLFNKVNINKDGRGYYCKACVAQRTREYYAAKPEGWHAEKERERRWVKAAKEGKDIKEYAGKEPIYVTEEVIAAHPNRKRFETDEEALANNRAWHRARYYTLVDTDEKREQYNVRHRLSSRAYYYAHREELLASSRAYYYAHREELLAKRKVYYEEHKEQTKVKDHERYLRRKAEASAERELVEVA